MDTAELILLGCSLFNIVLSATLLVFLRLRVIRHVLAEKKAKSIYTWLCLPLAILCGVPLLIGVANVLNVSLWHGNILFASALVSILVSLFTVLAGRIIIGWVPIKW